MKTFVIKTPDRVELEVYHWATSMFKRPKGIIQIVHGVLEHMGRYEWIANQLTSAGFEVVGFDLRGHGKTATRNQLKGYFADQIGWQRVVHDIIVVGHYFRKKMPKLPIFLLGHSMGSFLSQQAVVQDRAQFTGLILSGTTYLSSAKMSGAHFLATCIAGLKGKRHVSNWLHQKTFDGFNDSFSGRTPYDWISSVPEEVDQYIQDPDCGYVGCAQLYTDLFECMARTFKKSFLKQVPRSVPVYLCSGQDDPVSHRGTRVQALANSYEKLGHDVTTQIYPGNRHELFHDRAKQTAVDDLIAWISNVYKPHKL